MMKQYVALLNEMNGQIRWELIKSAMQNDIFGFTDRWVESSYVAEVLNTDTHKTSVYLDALVCCGYLEKCCGRYINTDVSSKYLVRTKELYQGDLILSLAERRLAGMNDIVSLMKQGTPQMPLSDEKVWQDAFNMLIPFQKAVSEGVLKTIFALKDIERMKSMLDLGGGPGYIGLSVIREYPDMTLTLFDLPKVIEMAENAHTDEKIRFIAGDYSKDCLGDGYDIIWASRSLYYADNLNSLMDKVASSLNKGGYFISVHEGIYNERTQPSELILSRLGVALTGSDVSLCRGRMEEALRNSGFELVSIRTTDDIGGEADVIIGRKM